MFDWLMFEWACHAAAKIGCTVASTESGIVVLMPDGRELCCGRTAVEVVRILV